MSEQAGIETGYGVCQKCGAGLTPFSGTCTNEECRATLAHKVTCNSGLSKYPNGVPKGICADRNCDCGAIGRHK